MLKLRRGGKGLRKRSKRQLRKRRPFNARNTKPASRGIARGGVSNGTYDPSGMTYEAAKLMEILEILLLDAVCYPQHCWRIKPVDVVYGYGLYLCRLNGWTDTKNVIYNQIKHLL